MTWDERRLGDLLDVAAPPSDGVAFERVARRVRRRRALRWSAVTSAVAAVGAVASLALAGSPGNDSVSRLSTAPSGAPTAPAPTAPAGTAPAGQAPAGHAAPGIAPALGRRVPCPAPPGRVVTREQLARFHAVAAVMCERDQRGFRGQGQWLVWVRRVATGGVAAVQAAYERPGEEQTAGSCPLVAFAAPPLLLVDARGNAVVPTVPRDRCRQPQRAVLAAVDHAQWRVVSVRKLRQLVTPRAEAARCSMEWKNENWLAGRFGTHQSAGGPVFRHPPAVLHVCVYRVTGGDLEAGRFQRGFTLPAAGTARLLTALQGAGHTGGCPAQRRFAVVSTPAGEWANVELGGCWRVQRSYPTTGTGTADAAVARALLLGR